ncbi:MAG: glycoside hydrolase family 66 protein, partial [Verrucomicrobiota bacterium]
VQAVDSEGHSVVDVSALAPYPASPGLSAGSGDKAPALRVLHPFILPAGLRSAGEVALDVSSDKVWVQPDQPNQLIVNLNQEDCRPGTHLNLRIETALGVIVFSSTSSCKSGENRIPVPALKEEGGYIVRVDLAQSERVIRRGETVLSAVKNVADDLRYGFYASFGSMQGDYDARAAMLARLHINAVEFYDYFPAHGYYAPREPEYRTEPFGIHINTLDIRHKIEADKCRNILSLAYVAAYAASESVYRKYPFPMTDENGAVKIFNGRIMSEEQADREKKKKWFWIMNVADDSPWHTYIMSEFRRALGDHSDALVSFDGFEIDTYGDNADARFYARGSRRNGDLLRDVLHDFVGDVQSLTHEVKPYGLVSFNSVNEFGVQQMVDVTDFLFLEVWNFYADQLGALVDVCFRNREPRRQRVILKIYPADMNLSQSSWPPGALRRVLAAAMTGGGSLMVAGEPDEQKNAMHGLNTLYYPDHRALQPDSQEILHDYYRQDAMLLGYTHGHQVFNTPIEVSVPDCITRTFAAPDKQALVVQFLQTGEERRWSVDASPPTPKVNYEVSLKLPDGGAPNAVYFSSPDVPALQTPVKLDFDITNGRLRTLLPELRVHGTLVVQY